MTWICKEVESLEKKQLPQVWWVQHSLFKVDNLEPVVPWNYRRHGTSTFKGPNLLKNEMSVSKNCVWRIRKLVMRKKIGISKGWKGWCLLRDKQSLNSNPPLNSCEGKLFSIKSTRTISCSANIFSLKSYLIRQNDLEGEIFSVWYLEWSPATWHEL